jgi:hypothetical protein
MRDFLRSLRALEVVTVFLFIVALTSLTWPQEQIPDSAALPVRQAVTSWWDVLRLYVFPAMGTLLMGAVAIILEWIRRAMLKATAETAKTVQLAQVAAKKTEEVGVILKSAADRHWGELEEIKDIARGTYNMMSDLHKQSKS